MATFAETRAKNIESGVIPGIIIQAISADSKWTYSDATGVRSTKPENNTKPLDPDTVLSIASCTKLLVAIGVLQAVERGLVKLDDDVAPIAPELANIEIITGFDDAANQPELKQKTKPITLRNLLTHSSGFGYELSQPMLLKWRKSVGGIPWSGKTIEERCLFPLMFEPDSAWMYGSGTDWAGKILERIAGVTLEDYIAENISKPLGLKDITFWPQKRADLGDRTADTSMLDPKSKKAVPLAGFDMVNGLEECLGGGGAFATVNEYMKVLHAVLVEDDRLLKKESYEKLFSDQLSEESRNAMNELLAKDPAANIQLGMNLPTTGNKTWSLGGQISLDDYPGWIGKGTLQWGGMTGIKWFVDRQNGLCGMAACQVMTFGQPEINDMLGIWKKEIYKKYASEKESAS